LILPSPRPSAHIGRDRIQNARHPYITPILSARPRIDFANQGGVDRILLEGEVPSSGQSFNRVAFSPPLLVGAGSYAPSNSQRCSLTAQAIGWRVTLPSKSTDATLGRAHARTLRRAHPEWLTRGAAYRASAHRTLSARTFGHALLVAYVHDAAW
jgi:hypothetical protein